MVAPLASLESWRLFAGVLFLLLRQPFVGLLLLFLAQRWNESSCDILDLLEARPFHMGVKTLGGDALAFRLGDSCLLDWCCVHIALLDCFLG